MCACGAEVWSRLFGAEGYDWLSGEVLGRIRVLGLLRLIAKQRRSTSGLCLVGRTPDSGGGEGVLQEGGCLVHLGPPKSHKAMPLPQPGRTGTCTVVSSPTLS